MDQARGPQVIDFVLVQLMHDEHHRRLLQGVRARKLRHALKRRRLLLHQRLALLVRRLALLLEAPGSFFQLEHRTMVSHLPAMAP